MNLYEFARKWLFWFQIELVNQTRLKISNAFYNCADIGSLYISHIKQIIHALRKQRTVSTSVDWQTEDKKKAVGSKQ